MSLKIDSQKQCQLRYSERWSTVWLKDILPSIRGSVLSIKIFKHCTLFPSSRFLSHWVFPGKVLTRQCRTRVNIHRILCYTWLCTLFSFDQFLSHWVFTGKVFNEAYSISFVVSKGECCKSLKVEPTEEVFLHLPGTFPSLYLSIQEVSLHLPGTFPSLYFTKTLAYK